MHSFVIRALGALIAVLGRGEVEEVPAGSVIAICLSNLTAETSYLSKLSWNQASKLLENDRWKLAASDSYLKLYIYKSLKILQDSRPELAKDLPYHLWYFLTLQDKVDQFYEVILGLPEPRSSQSSVVAIDKLLTRQIESDPFIHISEFPGLSTFLKAAFAQPPDRILKEGTTLSVATGIIVEASDLWDYCAILLPERSENGEESWLIVQEQSSKSPRYLNNKKDEHIDVGQPIIGWCYSHCQNVIVEPVIENDPRLAFSEEELPVAVAAVPAITEEQRVVGVVYVARYYRDDVKQSTFTEELTVGLEALGYVCGDIIARDQVEIETVRSLARLCTRSWITSFPDLDALLVSVVNQIRRGINLEQAPHSWIYLLTLNMRTTSQDMITQWLCQQGIELICNFLSNHLWDPPHLKPLPIGLCEVSPGHYVFAILCAVDLPEEKYHQRINHLQQEISQMHIGRLSPDFYPSGITFRYEDLRRKLNDKGMKWLLTDLIERTRGALIAAPYIIRGHEALHEGDLDQAVLEFKAASNNVSNSWYVYKHLAEVYMLRGLRGTEKDLELAVESCQKALELNTDYASAHCLLADCMFYLGKFCEALLEYEKALNLISTRRDFLIRYGFALAGMTTSQYQEALRYLKHQEPTFLKERSYSSEPLQEAIKKFDEARNLSHVDETIEEQRVRRAEYHSQLGYAYLQAGYIDEALEDFAAARKLAPDDLQLEPIYRYTLSLLNKKAGESRQ